MAGVHPYLSSISLILLLLNVTHVYVLYNHIHFAQVTCLSKINQTLIILFSCPQPKPTKGRMRIHCLENVDKALQFLKEQRVHLENMGSHDIVDGNHRLTLGLIWTIILRFQVTLQTIRNELLELTCTCTSSEVGRVP